MWNQKYAKSCCHKTNLGNYFDDPTLSTESLRYACVNTAALHCSKEAGSLEPRLYVPDFVSQLWRKIGGKAWKDLARDTVAP